MIDQFSTSIKINSGPAEVWNTLTNPELMTQWLGEPEMRIEVITNWQIDAPVLIRGFHNNRKFENKGTVLQYDKEKKLQYSHLSSVSRLPDRAENYSILEFMLTPHAGHTFLTLHIENFPTESIRKHLEFYWKATIVIIKAVAENI